MKVVQINSVCGSGSTGKIAVDISRSLNEKGIENYILYGVGKSEHPQGISISDMYYVKMNIAMTRLFGKHGFYSHGATHKLIKHLKRIKPDVIHLHNIHGHYLNVKMLFWYIKKYNIKTIWTLHDCWSFTGHCSHFNFVGCEKWKEGCHNCEQLREYPVSLVFDRSCGTYKAKKDAFLGVNDLTIVTPSDWLGEMVSQSFLKDYDHLTLNNGIDLSLFKPCESDIKEKLGIAGKKVILAVSAHYGERKGYKYYIELAKRLPKDYVMVMVGVSDEQKKTLPQNIIGITRTENQGELVKLYTAADVMVNLTLEDTFPTVNIEALACGTPVVTWRVGGSPEIVGKECGEVTDALDLDAIYEATLRVSNEKEKYTDKCIKRAQNKYDKSKMIEAYMELYGVKGTGK